MNLYIRRYAPWGAIAAAALFAFALASCGGDDSADDAAAAGAPTSDTPAAELRAKLNTILAEHTMLAANATGAALGGRAPEFDAAAAALDGNSVELAEIVGSVYGDDAETAFLDGWRELIGFFVSYTNAAATGDAAAKEQALADLGEYAQSVGTLFNAANGLPVDTVVAIVEEHARTLISVIDAQAAGDVDLAYTRLRESIAHMHMLADPLTEATVQTFPDVFAAPAVD